jgi:hypothetical protein
MKANGPAAACTHAIGEGAEARAGFASGAAMLPRINLQAPYQKSNSMAARFSLYV